MSAKEHRPRPSRHGATHHRHCLRRAAILLHDIALAMTEETESARVADAPTTTTATTADRQRLARWLLAPLLAFLLASAAWAPWHSTMGCDQRTYFEMTWGVAAHGLPYTYNGPLERFPELIARWNVASSGQRLFGGYAPLYPYLAAPLFRLDGTRGAIRLTLLFLPLLALGVFRLGRRLSGDPLLGTAAAYVTLLGTTVWSYSLDTTPYSLVVTCVVWSLDFGAATLAAQGVRARWLAAAAGLVAALAVAAHLLALPMLAALVGCLALLPASRAGLAWPTSRSLGLATIAALAALPPLVAMALLNHVRFGSYNPISYGAPTKLIIRQGTDKQQIGLMLRYCALPAMGAGLALLGWLRLRTVWLRVGSVIAALAGIVLVGALPAAAAVGALAWALVVDVSNLPLYFGRVAGGPGLRTPVMMLGTFVVKAPLQCAPVLVLAAAARFSEPNARRGARLVTLTGAAIYTSLLLRANLPLTEALGFPNNSIRYMTPLLPLAALLAMCALRRLPWRWRDVVVVVVLALAFAAALSLAPDDGLWLRRFVLLRVTLALALAALVAVVRARPGRGERLAIGLSAATIALGIAIVTSVDLRALVAQRNGNDKDVDAVAALLPDRFALLGWPMYQDPLLVLRARRDVEYGDLLEWKAGDANPAELRALLHHWRDDGRPVFLVGPSLPKLPEVRLQQLPAPMPLYRLDLTALD
jgi:hypothetical protein